MLLFISDYDRRKGKDGKERGLQDLPGTANDKKRLYDLFRKDYNYTVIQTKNKKVTKAEFTDTLNKARDEFKNRPYDGVLVFYAGHGDQNWLCCSDKKIPRIKFERWFNGVNVVERANAFKFYFIDSCRGGDKITQDAGGNAMGNQNNNDSAQDECKGNIEFHPETNKVLIHGNSNGYVSYQVPYNDAYKDIDWLKIKSMNADTPRCGVFSNAVYWCFKQNVLNNYETSWNELVDIIIEKGNCEGPDEESSRKESAKVKAARLKYISIYHQSIRIDSPLKNKTKKALIFKHNTQ